MGLGQLNASAVCKRLQPAEEWLRWMAKQMRARLGMMTPPGSRSVRVVDAKAVSEPGSTGADWKIHYAINLSSLQCDFFLLSDISGGRFHS
jgi:hypothetical protein